MGALDGVHVDVNPVRRERPRTGHDRGAVAEPTAGVEHRAALGELRRPEVARQVLGFDQLAPLSLGNEALGGERGFFALVVDPRHASSPAS